jgi:hypothetical protein
MTQTAPRRPQLPPVPDLAGRVSPKIMIDLIFAIASRGVRP